MAPDYWLDSNALITPHSGPYSFDLAPGFWVFLDQKMAGKVIGSTRLVCQELMKGNDQLAEWAAQRKDSEFFAEPDGEVQKALQKVAEYVHGHYVRQHASVFLAGADPWLIAHAMVRGGKVVTAERSQPGSGKPKIPDVAAQFGVECTTIYNMLKQLGASFR